MTCYLQASRESFGDILEHSWDSGTPLDETFRALNDLVRAGKIMYIGISNVVGWQLQKICCLVKELGLEAVVSLQTQYSLLCRWPEWELLPVCQNEGLGILPWSPLKGGWLSGKYSKDMQAPPEGSRVAWAEKTGVKLQVKTAPQTRDIRKEEHFGPAILGSPGDSHTALMCRFRVAPGSLNSRARER